MQSVQFDSDVAIKFGRLSNVTSAWNNLLSSYSVNDIMTLLIVKSRLLDW